MSAHPALAALTAATHPREPTVEPADEPGALADADEPTATDTRARLRATPLRERRGFTHLTDAAPGPSRPGRGLAALIPTSGAVTTEAARERVVSRAEATAAVDVRARIETEWLRAPLLDAYLHHPADLPLLAAHDLTTDERTDAPIGTALVLSCGQITAALAFPGRWERDAADGSPRCPACCAALGYPAGTGAPGNGDACRPVLSALLAGLS